MIFISLAPVYPVFGQNESTERIQQISNVKADRNGDGEADRAGQRVTVAGRATVGTGVLHKEYFRIFLQDSTAGIQLFTESYDRDRPVERGDSLVVTGELTMYYGKPEILVEEYKVIDVPRRVPGRLSVNEALSDPRRYEGRLVEGEGMVTGRDISMDNKNIDLVLVDSTRDNFQIYINDLHPLFEDFDLDDMGVGDHVRVQGIFSIFIYENSGYSVLQVLPRTPDDLSFASIPDRYLSWIAIGGGVLLLLIGGWVVALRAQVKSKTRRINKSLDEKETLLREIHHRVKNNLAVISGLIQMQLAGVDSEETKDVLRDTEARIRSMAMIHDNLYQSSTLSSIDMNEYLTNLTRSIHRAYTGRGSGIDLKTYIESVNLEIDRAIPCALMVNELMTNAYKHAFEEQEKGQISIRMVCLNGSAELIVSDNGRGLPEDFDINRTNTLGMKLIQTFSSQLDAEMKIERDEGTRFRFKIPLNDNKGNDRES